ncbi:hypothetical protein BOTBODRAFT_65126 [Botryobasidium botryosum FD-172 SS1]|uniref:Protein kinase domain-containing protein n=1 Tax=Botryobasidium botryosum (strain FD-172 SS1) TaxID=930990 RepID=A0A067MVG6_BOTB1|nr:hypothetical protein BOTBODRAFT_65126 [Botryobasidium botryosum FD-172 SS1]
MSAATLYYKSREYSTVQRILATINYTRITKFYACIGRILYVEAILDDMASNLYDDERALYCATLIMLSEEYAEVAKQAEVPVSGIIRRVVKFAQRERKLRTWTKAAKATTEEFKAARADSAERSKLASLENLPAHPTETRAGARDPRNSHASLLKAGTAAIRFAEMATEMRKKMNALPEGRRYPYKEALSNIYDATGIYPCDEGLMSSEIGKFNCANSVEQGGYDFWERGTFLDRHEVVLKQLAPYGSSKSASGHFDDRSCVERLVKIWASFNHPYVLRLIGCYTEQHGVCVVAPYMPNGNACTYIREHNNANCSKVLLQVAEGLEYIHGMGAVHGEICGSNVLIATSGHACIADFGLSDMAERCHPAEYVFLGKHGGGPRWKAPELFRFANNQKPACTTQSDIFAFGRLIYELTTDRMPFHESKDEYHALRRIWDGEKLSMPKDVYARRRGLTDGMWALAEDCWAEDPNSRPTAREAAQRLKSLGI